MRKLINLVSVYAVMMISLVIKKIKLHQKIFVVVNVQINPNLQIANLFRLSIIQHVGVKDLREVNSKTLKLNIF